MEVGHLPQNRRRRPYEATVVILLVLGVSTFFMDAIQLKETMGPSDARFISDYSGIVVATDDDPSASAAGKPSFAGSTTNANSNTTITSALKSDQIDLLPRFSVPHSSLNTTTTKKNKTTKTGSLTDPEHTTRLKHFREMESFPVPAFHGCSPGTNLCRFSNVCYSQRDRLLVPGAHGIEETGVSAEDGWYLPSSDFSEKLVPIRKPQLVPREEYFKWKRVYFADKVLAMNCWQQRFGDKNPAHMIMGMGRLFVHASGYWDGDEASDGNKTKSQHQTMDLLLYHQCTPVEGWPWGEYVQSIIWEEAVAQKSVRPPRSDASMYLSYEEDDRNQNETTFPKHDDVIVCGKTVYQEPFTSGIYFSNNNRNVTNRWQKLVSEEVRKDPEIDDDFQPDNRTLSHHPEYDQNYCIHNLRIAAFQRTEGTSLRRFHNMDVLRTMVEQYTRKPFRILSPTAATPPREQVALFRSFDILLTPHGSHNVNMIFATGRSVFVEVSSVFYDGGPKANGFAFANWWYNSYGHEPYNNTHLAEQLPACLASGDGDQGPQDLFDPACPLFPTRLDFIHSDVVLNATILRYHLEKAIYTLCGGPSQTTMA